MTWGESAPRGWNFLVFVLQLVKLVIDSALREQLLVSAHLADLALVHDDNLVRSLNGRQTVGDHERGAAFDHAIERVTDPEFGFGIYARRGFIKDQDLRIMRQGARETDELFLSGRKG